MRERNKGSLGNKTRRNKKYATPINNKEPAMKLISAFLTTLISSGLIACTTNSPAKPKHSIQNKMSQLDKEVKTLVGSASCTSNKQCHTIGYGDKPCGGFMSFQVYSEQNTNVTLLMSKVAQYNQLSKQWNRDNDAISNCMMLMPPELTCRNQTCQIK